MFTGQKKINSLPLNFFYSGRPDFYRTRDLMEFIPFFVHASFCIKTHIHGKNHKKERFDAWLHVDQLSDVRWSRSGARPPIDGQKSIHTPGSGSLDSDKHTALCVFYIKK
jgi:hypothetical protein